MSTPLPPPTENASEPSDPDLASALEQVDLSRARSTAVEDQYAAQTEDAYAQALLAWQAANGSEESGHPLLTAVLLATVVALIRKAFGGGANEGAVYANSLIAPLGLKDPSLAFDGTNLTSGSKLPDKLVSDFLAGQAAGGKLGDNESAQGAFGRLADRAKAAVSTAFYGGRGEATESAFARVSALVKSQVHKMWVARFDSSDVCAYCVRLHGTHVPIGDDFPVPSTEPPPYGGVLRRPPRHPNCRCHLALYFPSLQASAVGPSPFTMMSYAEQVLAAVDAEGNDFVRATIVLVKPYERTVNGHVQQVDGYYYDIQSGLKISIGHESSLPAQAVSVEHAKEMTAKAKQTAKISPNEKTSFKFGPGTYEISLPDHTSTHLIVHKDGSGSAIHNETSENISPAQSEQFLHYWDAQGKVQKLSHGDGSLANPHAEPNQALEPSHAQKSGAVPPPGHYILPESSNYDGFQVHHDNSVTVHKNGFTSSFKAHGDAANLLGKKTFGEFVPVDKDHFNSDWQKKFESAKAAEESASALPGLEPHNPPDPEWFIPGPEDEKFSPTQQESALKDYVLGSQPYNDPLRFNDAMDEGGDPEYYSTNVRAIDSTMIPSDSSMTLYRNVDNATKFMGDLQPGDVFEEKGYLSTTLVEGGLGDEFGGDLITIQAPKGTPMSDLTEINPDENEFLIARNTRLQLVSKSGVPGELKMTMKVVPSEPLTKKVVPAATVMPWNKKYKNAFEADVPNVSDGPDIDLPQPVFPAKGVDTVQHTKLYPLGSSGKSISVDEGSQVFASKHSSNSLYVLSPNGDLHRHQANSVAPGGVSATLIGSSANPSARASLLASLENISHSGGTDVVNVTPPPGTTSVAVGGVQVTSTQLDDAINLLTKQKSHSMPTVYAGLQKAGSPLAAADLQALSAPYQHSFTTSKPAVIKALKAEKAKAGETVLSEAGTVASFNQGPHGPDGPKLDQPDINYGLSDSEAIEGALSALDPQAPAPGYGLHNDGPGTITIKGAPYTPLQVSQAIDALKGESSTSVKGPLKAQGNALAGADLQGLANDIAGAKVHYGKLKPAVIDALQNALDEHQKAAPPDPEPHLGSPGEPNAVADVDPTPTVTFGGTQGTPAQLQEVKDWIEAHPDKSLISTIAGLKVSLPSSNPFTHTSAGGGPGWLTLAKASDGTTVSGVGFSSHILPQINAALAAHEVNAASNKVKTASASLKQVQQDAENALPVSMQLLFGDKSVEGNVGELKAFLAHVQATHPATVSSVKELGGGPEVGAFGDQSAANLTPPGPWSSLSDLGKKKTLVNHLQSTLDQAVNPINALPEEKNLAPAAPSVMEAPAPEGPPPTVSVGGKDVSKKQIEDAIAALKGESSTSVKGPLKAMGSPLAAADLKGLAEADAGSTIHYGKLKAAVIDSLQTKADSLPDVPSGQHDPDGNVVSPAEVETPAAPVAETNAPHPPGVWHGPNGKTLTVHEDGSAVMSSLYWASDQKIIFPEDFTGSSFWKKQDQALAEDPGTPPAGTADPHVGTWSNANSGSTMVVYPNGSGTLHSTHSPPHNLGPEQVHKLIDDVELGFTKVSDSVEQPGYKHGMKVGVYDAKSADGTPVKYHVLSSGDVALVGQQGMVKMKGPEAKAIIGNLGVDPLPLATPSMPEELKSKDYNEFVSLEQVPPTSPHPTYLGIPTGVYITGSGESVVFDENGLTVPGSSPVAPGNGAGLVENFANNYKSNFSVWSKVGIYSPDSNSLVYSQGSTLQLQEDGSITIHADHGESTYMGNLGGNSYLLNHWKFSHELSSPSEEAPPAAPEAVPAAPDLPENAVQLGSFPHPYNSASIKNLEKPVLLASIKSWVDNSPYAGVAGLHLSSLDKASIVKWAHHWGKGEFDKAFAIEATKVKNHKGKGKHPGDPANPANAGGFTKPHVLAAVPGEMPAGSIPPGPWKGPDSPQYESPFYWNYDKLDSYLSAAGMQNPTGISNYSKKNWVNAHFHGDKIYVDAASIQAAKNVAHGNHLSEPIVPDVETYAPGQVMPGSYDIDPSKMYATNLNAQQVDDYIKHMAPKSTAKLLLTQNTQTKQGLVALHAVAAAKPGTTTFKPPSQAKQELESILAKVSSDADYSGSHLSPTTGETIHQLLSVADKTFTLDAEQPHLVSTQKLYHVSDQEGKKYLFKVAAEPFRADAEHAAHVLAGMAGLKTADSKVGSFQGQHGQFQSKIDSKSTLMGVDVKTLPISALKDIMSSHVFDWSVNNDDGADRNFLLSPDGKHVYPIDMGRAFATFGTPAMQLKIGSLSDRTHVIYNDIYSGILNHSYSDQDVDSIYHAMISQAKRQQNVPDEKWHAAVYEGSKDRPNFQTSSAKNIDDLATQAVARKNSLVADFEKFWDDIYAHLGRSKPEAPKSSLDKHVRSGNNADWHEHASTMGHAGAASFFAGTGLEDGHLLAQQVEKADGSGTELWFSGKLRPELGAQFEKWLAANSSNKINSGSLSNKKKDNDKTSEFLMNNGLSDGDSVITQAAKTISHHNSKGDTEYNQTKIEPFESFKGDIEQKLAQINNGNYPADLPEVDHDSYKQLIEGYASKIKFVDELKDSGGQSSPGDLKDSTFNLSPPPVVSPDVDTAPESSSGPAVKSVPANYEGFNLDKNNAMKSTGSPIDGGDYYNGTTGSMYQVELADGTVLEYLPWSANAGVNKSQRGEIRIKVRNYDGSVSSTNAAFDFLSTAGVDLEDASDEDLELLYWRHMYAAMLKRSDVGVSPQSKVVTAVKDSLPGGALGTPGLSKAAEIEAWRSAWSQLAGPEKVDQWVEKRGFLPRFSRANPAVPDEVGGQPFWYRFDVDYNKVYKNNILPSATTTHSTMPDVLKTGALLSTEDRMRIGGFWSSGSYSSAQADQGNDSSNNVYFRQNQKTFSAQFYSSPLLAARTTSYAWDYDHYGNAIYKPTEAKWNFDDHTSFSSGGNEMMTKHAVTILDDMELIAFPDKEGLDTAKEIYSSWGITDIRGLPLSMRLVLQKDAEKALQAINDHRKSYEAMLDVLPD